MFGKKKKGVLPSLIEKRQKEDLKRFKAEQKRKQKLEKMRSETEEYRARVKHERARKRAEKIKRRGLYVTVERPKVPLLETGLPKKKKQGKRLSRKSPIRLI